MMMNNIVYHIIVSNKVHMILIRGKHLIKYFYLGGINA